MIELYIKLRDWILWKFFNRIVVTNEQLEVIDEYAEEYNLTRVDAIYEIMCSYLESYNTKG